MHTFTNRTREQNATLETMSVTCSLCQQTRRRSLIYLSRPTGIAENEVWFRILNPYTISDLHLANFSSRNHIAMKQT
jgi:hypothetical protein